MGYWSLELNMRVVRNFEKYEHFGGLFVIRGQKSTFNCFENIAWDLSKGYIVLLKFINFCRIETRFMEKREPIWTKSSLWLCTNSSATNNV
jgi:hypothetical protein